MCHARMGLLLVILGLVTSCGGGSSNGGVFNIGGGNNGGSGTGNGMNTWAVIVDGGPVAAGGTVNTPFTTVTICAPGSTSECQTIDHVQVDTGSTGFRVLASVLGNGLTAVHLPQASDGNGNALDECVQFADGYSWGAVRTADLILGSEIAATLPIHVIGDPAAPPVPASCVTGPEENTVQSFGANGILGIGNFLTDCGMACETGAIAGTYYGCDSSANCLPVAIAVTQQLRTRSIGAYRSSTAGVYMLPSKRVRPPA